MRDGSASHFMASRSTAVRYGLAVLGAGILGLFLATVAIGQSTEKEAPPPGFDYWQPEWMVRELWGPGRMPKSMMARLLRHTTFVNLGVPKEYEDATSPLTPSPEVIQRGGQVYVEHCTRCHGAKGMGDGDAGMAVSPSPALLAYMIRKPVSVDEYLLWTISDGGKQFNTDMPAYRGILSRADIWHVIAYMRAGFPRIPAAAKAGDGEGDQNAD